MQKKDQFWLFVILIVLLVFFTLILFLGNGAYGGADNIAHFSIARYAFEYPRLFFDHWGKPVFTLLMALPAQLGFKAAQWANLLVGLATIFLSADILKKSSVRFNPGYLFFIAFSPMYFLLMQSCLTEVLLSFFLMLAIWLFLSGNYGFAAIVLSFLPFVRTESVVVIPFFIAGFLWKRKYFTLPLLLTGSLLYTIAGYFIYQDLLWIIHQMPYDTGGSIYGHGGLFDFVTRYDEIFGLPFTIFLVAGLLIWSWQILKKPDLSSNGFWLFVLATGSWMTYFAAHSYVWWKGTGGSLGLIRVMAGIIPLAAFAALAGLNWLTAKIKIPVIAYLIVAGAVIWQITVPFRQHPVPFKWEQPQQLMIKAADHIKKLDKNRIYYFDPFLIHFLGIDPYDQKISNWGIADKVRPSSSMEINDLLVWDAHFGPNEAGVSLDRLMEDPFLQLENSILPSESFKVLGGYDYGIFIFRKTERKTIAAPKEFFHREIEFSSPAADTPLSERLGKLCLVMDEKLEFSQPISVSGDELKADATVDIMAFVRFYPEVALSADAALLVLSVENEGKTLSYNKADLLQATDVNGWKELSMPLKLSNDFPRGYMINLYIWNKEKQKILIAGYGLTIKSLGR